ncbi:SIS domain-containing protein [Actinophytocola algeriensis]|uniref:Fructoselysine-6-P-deglycase FrlB-like protein n=1 Tax=Actinophytocola algeriensis TaxID=1768010 RepID=A0A7W7QBW6_9PSEU|nr:SIS domain-containing protein [Actinophytocola algeriensis]MBB4910429.1 fructoselysine-6-P-deglycase FrlB-like protein [Actinophytocola algeriensis]MBE1480582.1 fructoselysine-6-P-deglycase FrlB-like protein [Actinophytocola algeriensis]
MTYLRDEIASQPSVWERALEVPTGSLPASGERVAVIGCGTSYYMAQAYAALREAAGHGETDAFAASEFPAGRRYDRVVALTRSGTTTEVLAALARTSTPTVAVTADPATPISDVADQVLALEFADEKSVVQTRFATAALVLLRASLGEPLPGLTTAATAELATSLPRELVAATQWTFLGTGWTIGLANEAALKLREATQSWTESYYAMEYRHGPISIAAPGRVVWVFGEAPTGLVDEVKRTGAHIELSTGDPLVSLVRAHRVAEAVAEARGLDPDRPRNLDRSVILT